MELQIQWPSFSQEIHQLATGLKHARINLEETDMRLSPKERTRTAAVRLPVVLFYFLSRPHREQPCWQKVQLLLGPAERRRAVHRRLREDIVPRQDAARQDQVRTILRREFSASCRPLQHKGV